MKRRDATGWILKSAIFTPGLISALQACQQKMAETNNLLVLDQGQFNLCNALADTILPKTDSPSASEVKVIEFMDLLLKDVFESNVVDAFITGLQQFDHECQAAKGKSFKDLGQDRMNDYLAPLDEQIMGQAYDDEVPFYYTFKRLCITIYYSTEQGLKQNLDYQPVPGPYQGDIELKPGDKIMAGNQM